MTMTESKSTTPSPAETAARIKRFLKENRSSSKNATRQDAARLDELRRLLTQQALLLEPYHRGGSAATQQWQAFLESARQQLMDQLLERVHQGTLLGVTTTSGSFEWYCAFFALSL